MNQNTHVAKRHLPQRKARFLNMPRGDLHVCRLRANRRLHHLPIILIHQRIKMHYQENVPIPFFISKVNLLPFLTVTFSSSFMKVNILISISTFHNHTSLFTYLLFY